MTDKGNVVSGSSSGVQKSAAVAPHPNQSGNGTDSGPGQLERKADDVRPSADVAEVPPPQQSADLQAAEVAAAELDSLRGDPEAIRRAFETGEYPYKQKLQRKDYEKQKAELQLELLKVQD
jgi:hypothetical protein